jgi:hypothetical protein
MAVVIPRSADITVNSGFEALGYLTTYVYDPAQTPFPKRHLVDILDRSALPSDVAAFNVGVVVLSPSDQPICSILVLTNDGRPVVVSIPKAHLASSGLN